MSQKPHVMIQGKECAISGRFPRVIRLYAEYHEYIDDPESFLPALKSARAGADIFSFLQPVTDRTPRYRYRQQWDSVAVLEIETYEKWWKEQINDKTRNMVRKAGKKGVAIQAVPFDDDLARGIHAIYNESPLVQGRPSKHYGKSFETLKQAHETFLERSLFISAVFQGEIIGFIKLIMQGQSATIMQIMSKVSHRDKAPTNGLLGKAVEICAERGVRQLQYGIWSRRSLGEFKKHHGFTRVEIPRYFVPLNPLGSVALGLMLHRSPLEFVPANFKDLLAEWRGKWYLSRYKSQARV